MYNKPLVSVIVPIYNVGKYLKQCIDSILSQTYQNIEIILVNDGSTDNCPEMCDNYAEKDVRVRIIHKSNGGLVNARHTGIRAARGEYLQFIDGDDWITSDMIELMMEKMLQYDVECVVCSYYLVGRKIKAEKEFFRMGYYDENRYNKEILPQIMYSDKDGMRRINPSVCTKLFKRINVMDYFYSVPSKITYGEDAAVTYPYFFNKCKSVYIMEQALYYYRQNPESMTKKYNKDLIENTIDLLKYLNKSIMKKDFFELEKQLEYYTIMVILYNFSNEKKGDIKSLFKRYIKLQKFMKAVNVKDCIRESDMNLFCKKHSVGLTVIYHGGGFALLTLMSLLYQIQMKFNL